MRSTPATVRSRPAHAGRTLAEGFEFFIMYGQTEAGPRMSYVPPQDAELWAHSIGRPVEGGTFRLIDAKGLEIAATEQPGELVFDGPNVMLGYAQCRADLDNPAGPSVLKTGDIAQRLENGYFQIMGRTSRFIKVFGLRIGLDEVESQLRAEGYQAYVCAFDENLVVSLLDAVNPAALRTQIARRYALPERVVHVMAIESVRLLSSGKVDYRGLARQAERSLAESGEPPSDLAALLRSSLRTNSLDLDKSFVEHGGDSLAYLEVQLLLPAASALFRMGGSACP